MGEKKFDLVAEVMLPTEHRAYPYEDKGLMVPSGTYTLPALSFATMQASGNATINGTVYNLDEGTRVYMLHDGTLNIVSYAAMMGDPTLKDVLRWDKIVASKLESPQGQSMLPIFMQKQQLVGNSFTHIWTFDVKEKPVLDLFEKETGLGERAGMLRKVFQWSEAGVWEKKADAQIKQFNGVGKIVAPQRSWAVAGVGRPYISLVGLTEGSLAKPQWVDETYTPTLSAKHVDFDAVGDGIHFVQYSPALNGSLPAGSKTLQLLIGTPDVDVLKYLHITEYDGVTHNPIEDIDLTVQGTHMPFNTNEGFEVFLVHVPYALDDPDADIGIILNADLNSLTFDEQAHQGITGFVFGAVSVLLNFECAVLQEGIWFGDPLLVHGEVVENQLCAIGNETITLPSFYNSLFKYGKRLAIYVEIQFSQHNGQSAEQTFMKLTSPDGTNYIEFAIKEDNNMLFGINVPGVNWIDLSTPTWIKSSGVNKIMVMVDLDSNQIIFAANGQVHSNPSFYPSVTFDLSYIDLAKRMDTLEFNAGDIGSMVILHNLAIGHTHWELSQMQQITQ